MILSYIVLVALTSGIVEVFKRALKLPKKFCPLLALVVGFLLTLVGSITDITSLAILTGIAVGLGASGLYSNVKYPIKFLTKKVIPLS